MAPVRGTRPYVGRSPETPQNAEGQTIEPHVSEAIAKPTRPAAVAEADPDEEPHVQRVGSQGFFAAPVAEIEAVS
jgi:hypothetical protein